MAYELDRFTSQGLTLGAKLQEVDGIAVAGAVMVTGGGTSAEDLFTDWQKYLAEQGVTSLTFDARGKGKSHGYWSTRGNPEAPLYQINSQASRVEDTVAAVKVLRQRVQKPKPIVIIGASMGGDIAVHAAQVLEGTYSEVGALCLKAPTAYHPIAHDRPYGELFTEVTEEAAHEAYPPLHADNFGILRQLGIPVQLIVSRGEDVVLPEITAEYMRVVHEDLPQGELALVGDETTRHAYFSADDEVSQQARQYTFERSAEFILAQTAQVRPVHVAK